MLIRQNAFDGKERMLKGALHCHTTRSDGDGTPEEVLNALKKKEKTEKGEYCVVLDLHAVPKPETEKQDPSLSAEAKLIEAMKQGMTLREAQETLIASGEKKNTVKQAAITLKKLMSNEM